MSNLVLFFFLFFSPNVWSYVELDLSFNYEKQVYGTNRENVMNSRVYSGSIAWYLTQFTAIEFSYGDGTQKTDENQSYSVSGTTLTILGHDNEVLENNYSVGVRQALAARSSFLKPTVSFGYTRQKITDQTQYTIRDSSSGLVVQVSESPEILQNDSVFASFALSLRLSRYFSIKGSVQTIFPAFEFDLAKDDVEYLIGISWIL